MKKIELPGFAPGEPIPLKATVNSIRLVRDKRIAHEREVRRLRRKLHRPNLIERASEFFAEVFYKGQ